MERRSLSTAPPPMRRRSLALATPTSVSTRRSLAPSRLLSIEEWPDRVYGYDPMLPHAVPICIVRDQRGYYEVSPEINPLARNREMGVEQDLADAVIRAAFAPGGHVWYRYTR